MLQDILGEEAMHLDIESVVRGLGVTECVKVRSYNLKALHSALEDMRDKKGVRVIIAEEPCVLYARRRLKKAAAQVAYVAEQRRCPALSGRTGLAPLSIAMARTWLWTKISAPGWHGLSARWPQGFKARKRAR